MTAMFAVDTNVLLRVLLDDDPVQSALARRLIERRGEADPLFIGLPVIMELAWTLRQREPRPYPRMLRALDLLLALSHVVVQERDIVDLALDRARRGLGDFADNLVALCAHSAGAATTFTFDRRAAHSGGFTLLTT